MQLKNGYKLIYEKADSNGDLHMYASKSTTPTGDDETVSIQGLDGAVMGHEADYPINVNFFNAYPYELFPVVEEGVKSLAGIMQYPALDDAVTDPCDLVEGDITTIDVNVKTVDYLGHRYYCVQHADTSASDCYYAPVMGYMQSEDDNTLPADAYKFDYFYWDDSTSSLEHIVSTVPTEDTIISADTQFSYSLLPGGDKWLIVHKTMRIPVYQWSINIGEETTEVTMTADHKILYGPVHFENGVAVSFTTDRLFMGYDDLASDIDDDTQAHISRGQNGEIIVNSETDTDMFKFVVDTHGKITLNYIDYYRVPAAYQEVEYLKSETGNAYFQIPYAFLSDCDTFDVIMTDTSNASSSTSYYYFGVNSSYSWYLWHNTNNYMRVNLSGPGSANLCSRVQNTKLRVIMSPTATYIRNYETGSNYGSWSYSRYTYTGATYYQIFSAGSNTPARMTFYNLKVYRQNENDLYSHLIPCYRKSDNVIGIYDTVSRTFITKSGSGTIIAGPDVSYEPEEEEGE